MLPKYGSPNGKSCQCHRGQIAVVGSGDSGHVMQSLGQHEALRRRPTRAIVIASHCEHRIACAGERDQTCWSTNESCEKPPASAPMPNESSPETGSDGAPSDSLSEKCWLKEDCENGCTKPAAHFRLTCENSRQVA